MVEVPVSYNRYVAVTPSDTVAIGETTAGDGNAKAPKALYVGGAGNLVAVQPDGRVVTFTGVPAGSVLPITVTRVNATSTTATAIVALYQV